MTARPRRKAPKLDVPQTIDDATRLLGDYSGFLTSAEQLRAEADAAIAAIQADRDALLKPLEERMKDIFRQLRSWWAVAGPAITEGKRKSVEIAGCIIGERTTPPRLALAKGMDDEDAVDAILQSPALDDEALIVTTMKLVKPLIIQLLKDENSDDARELRSLGFFLKQTDEFFIDRAAEKAPAVEQVAEAAE